MKRLIAVFVGVTAILILSTGNLYAQGDEKEKEKKGFVSFGVDIRLPTMVSKTYVPTTLENVPEFVRKVPIHKNDRGAGTIVMIPDNTIQPRTNNTAASLGASIAPQITVWRITARIGAMAYLRAKSRAWLHDAAVAHDEAADKKVPYAGPIREWSQWVQNSQRGYGTALVYYAAELKPKQPELYGEVEIRPFKHLSAITGYSQINYDLSLYSGWDRWNSLNEKYAEYPAIRIGMRRKYFGVRLSCRVNEYGKCEEGKSSVGIEFLVNHLSHFDPTMWQGHPVDLKYTQSPWSATFSVIWNLNIVGLK